MIETTEDIFRALRQVVHNDPVLQARLFALADPNEFLAAVRLLAQSMGCHLQDEDVQQVMRAGRRAWFERNIP